MALSIQSPANSFVQFSESSVVTSCNFSDIHLCYPVYADDDVWFQFIVEADSEAEADALCDLTNSLVSIGLSNDCEAGNLITFSEKPQRYRIGSRYVLYNWQEGFPGFTGPVNIGDCFFVRVTVNETEFCSNCFQRIGDECHTSVIEYGNDDDAFGFNYCSSEAVDTDSDVCDPTFVTFTDQGTLTIPYTASMQAKYGLVPTIKVWIKVGVTEYVNMSVSQKFDTYPPTQILLDFGGPATGVIKIS